MMNLDELLNSKQKEAAMYLDSKVGKHHGIRHEHPRRAATAAPRPR